MKIRNEGFKKSDDSNGAVMGEVIPRVRRQLDELDCMRKVEALLNEQEVAPRIRIMQWLEAKFAPLAPNLESLEKMATRLLVPDRQYELKSYNGS